MVRHPMSASRRTRIAFGLLVLAVTCVMACASAPLAAAAEGPVWKITSYSMPTNLMAPTDEVQAITVKTTGGGGTVGGIIPGYGIFSFAPGASAAEVQAVLAEQVGAGNVEVTGGPGDAAGTKPYVVTFKGSLAGHAVGTMSIFGSGFPNEGSEGATVSELRQGGSGGQLVITAVNVGGEATDGSAIMIRDVLPAGLSATSISGVDSYVAGTFTERPLLSAEMACSTLPALVCAEPAVAEPGDQLIVRIKVEVLPGAQANLVNQASVSGGGAVHGDSVSSATTVSAQPAGFGLVPGSVFAAVSSHQAGAHADVTTGFALTAAGLSSGGAPVTAGDAKDVSFDLPPGLVGNTVGLPQCTAAKVIAQTCPASTIVGVASTQHGYLGSLASDVNPIFDIAPSPGEPAAFMFVVSGLAPVRLDTSVLSNGNYAVRVTAGNISQAEPVFASYVTVWGVPADHEGPGPIRVPGASSEGAIQIGGPATSATRVPLLSNPTQCSTQLAGAAQADAWRRPGVFQEVTLSMGSMTGCDLMPFAGSMSMLPDTLSAGAPAGYSLDLRVPQGNAPDGLAQSLVKKVVTALPMGTVISPSASSGLQSCSDAQFFGPDRGGQSPAAPGACPRESQVGTVSITTPALPYPLTGEVYLATPHCGPCTPEDAQSGAMVRLFVQVVGEGESGIVVKLEGTASINQQTGQIIATFDNNPQLPFSDFKLTLGGGSRATLANPRTCGPATTTMGLTPWSSPFTSEISPLYTFEIKENCVTPQFNPSFVAGTTDIQAGEYSPFTVSFGRSDADEFLNGLQMQMPPGLLGSLAKVPLCREPQAAAGACGAESLIGHTQVLTGPGDTPFLVTGGQVFLTEGYKGAPFGLSIVVPAVAGPYTLAGTTGNGTVVVRASININPTTAALTVTSDQLPTELDGIPLQLKVVNVTIDRPGFTFNPTSCAKTAILGSLSSKEGASVAVSSPFQPTNCAGLGFKPRFEVSTSGKTSRANGASLDAKVIYPSGAQGAIANIAKVKVDLPKQLPSRLTTLQKACTAQTFNTNPGACPAASVVGIAKASTPILPVQLTGPVYFVSNGGEAFPNLIVVLQGYGIRVNLVGDTFISSAGITSSTFKQVPDVPINSFELYLPEGPHSALAANGNLCANTQTVTVRKHVTERVKGKVRHLTKTVKEQRPASLVMPTAFVGQNGAELHQSTKVEVTGCKVKQAQAGKAKRAKSAGKVSTRSSSHGNGRKQS
jgi:hypothetical protein